MEEAAASLGASRPRIFRSILLPNLTPAIVAGCALAFARAIGEYGSLVLITGNIPFDTQVASVYIFGRIESDAPTSAAAVSVFLLVLSVAVLFALNLVAKWSSRAMRDGARRSRGARDASSATACASSRSATSRRCSSCRWRSSSSARSRTGSAPPLEAITSPDGQHAFWLTLVCVGDRGAAEHGLRRDRGARAGAPEVPRQGDPQHDHRPAVRDLAGRDRARAAARLRRATAGSART